MTWPTTWDSLRAYRQKAPCGCRYRGVRVGHVIDVKVSPNRMQRCFRHMRVDAEQVRGELLEPLKGMFDA